MDPGGFTKGLSRILSTSGEGRREGGGGGEIQPLLVTPKGRQWRSKFLSFKKVIALCILYILFL